MNAKKRVLIIEDEPELREVLKDLLDDLGVDSELAENGEVGINKQKLTQFDLVISDLKMPKCSGLEVLKWMRSQKNQTPFIIQTGHGQANLEKEAAPLGVIGILEKPWDHRVLSDMIKNVLFPKMT